MLFIVYLFGLKISQDNNCVVIFNQGAVVLLIVNNALEGKPELPDYVNLQPAKNIQLI
jgi:hypothetical protein